MAAADVDETRLLNPNLLQVLESLYATRSVTRTAEQLGQTQSTISILLARLRKQLDDPRSSARRRACNRPRASMI